MTYFTYGLDRAPNVELPQPPEWNETIPMTGERNIYEIGWDPNFHIKSFKKSTVRNSKQPIYLRSGLR